MKEDANKLKGKARETERKRINKEEQRHSCLTILCLSCRRGWGLDDVVLGPRKEGGSHTVAQPARVLVRVGARQVHSHELGHVHLHRNKKCSWSPVCA
jgi:hypothetical protein